MGRQDLPRQTRKEPGFLVVRKYELGREPGQSTGYTAGLRRKLGPAKQRLDLGRPRWVDELRSGVRDHPSQHGETHLY